MIPLIQPDSDVTIIGSPDMHRIRQSVAGAYANKRPAGIKGCDTLSNVCGADIFNRDWHIWL